MFRSFCFEATLLLTIASEFEYVFSLKGYSHVIGPRSFGGARE